MALDFKKVAVVVGLFLAVILVCSFLYVYERREHQSNDVVDPGRFSDPSLKFVAVLFRHGNRGPLFRCNADPPKNAFPEGKGELTKKGKQNMYKKGQIFRRLYNGFLSDLYLDSEILIKTTNTRRTFMSAAMVLAGMYPPKDYQKWSDSETVWQPIPIYNDSPDHGTILEEQEKCPGLGSLLNQLNTQFGNQTDQNKTALMSYLSEKCGQPITQRNLIKLYDLFICQISDGSPLPEWIKPHQFKTIKAITKNKDNSAIFNGNRRLQNIVVGPLLREISLDMETRSTKSNHSTSRKMHLYSGHDISIAMAMNFLGNTMEFPDFGVSMHLHLYHDEINEHIIKVFYYDRWDDEKGKEILIPTCGDPCKLTEFKNLISNNLSREWAEECQQVEG